MPPEDIAVRANVSNHPRDGGRCAGWACRCRQDPVGGGKECAAIEAKVRVTSVRGYLAAAIPKRFSNARERYRHCISVAEAFADLRRLFQNHVAHCQSQTWDVRIL